MDMDSSDDSLGVTGLPEIEQMCVNSPLGQIFMEMQSFQRNKTETVSVDSCLHEPEEENNNKKQRRTKRRSSVDELLSSAQPFLARYEDKSDDTECKRSRSGRRLKKPTYNDHELQLKFQALLNKHNSKATGKLKWMTSYMADSFGSNGASTLASTSHAQNRRKSPPKSPKNSRTLSSTTSVDCNKKLHYDLVQVIKRNCKTRKSTLKGKAQINANAREKTALRKRVNKDTQKVKALGLPKLAGKHTIKRRRQLRQIITEINKDHQADLFQSSRLRKLKTTVDISDYSLPIPTSDTPGYATPVERVNQRKLSNSEIHASFSPRRHPAQRNNEDRELHRLRWQDQYNVHQVVNTQKTKRKVLSKPLAVSTPKAVTNKRIARYKLTIDTDTDCGDKVTFETDSDDGKEDEKREHFFNFSDSDS